jgi:predicted permease
MAQRDDPRPVTLVHGDSVGQVRATYVSANYFSSLGVLPARGRGFLPEEERQGGAPVVVLSHRLWQRQGADPKIVGQFVSANGVRCQVVGVAPEGFTGIALIGPDLWLPLGSYLTVAELARGATRRANAGPDRDYPSLHVVGRLKPDVNMPVAQAQLQSLVPRFKLEYPRQWRSNSSLYLRPPGRFLIDADVEQERLGTTIVSLVLMAVSAIILVIACLNLANMLIVQGAGRHREIAVRLAIGGGRWRIVRQLLLESLLLALLGGALGVLLAFWGTRVLNVWIAAAHDPEFRSFRPGLNLRVLAATLGFCLMATLLFGLRPALWLSRRDIAGEMKETGGSVLGPSRRKRGGLSAGGQIALAVVLVMSATLLTRSALQLARPNPRFDLEDKLVLQIDPLSAGYDRSQSIQVCEALADRLASLPGVAALGMSPGFFFGGGGPMSICEYLPGDQGSESRKYRAQRAAVTEVGRDYFTALEIPLLQGRLFDRLDSAPDAEKVTIIDETLARKLRPEGNALGCWIQAGFFTEYSEPYRVVGIVANVPGIAAREVHAQVYRPARPDQLSPYLYLHSVDRESAEMLRQRILQEIHRANPRCCPLGDNSPRDTATTIHGSRSARWHCGGAAALFGSGHLCRKAYVLNPEWSQSPVLQMSWVRSAGGIGKTVAGLIVGLLLGLGCGIDLLYGVRPSIRSASYDRGPARALRC